MKKLLLIYLTSLFGYTATCLNAQIPTDQLSAYFPFYTDPNFTGEYSENAIGFNSALWVGNISPTIDRFGNDNCALAFDGELTSYLLIQTSDVFDSGETNELSISLWMKGGSNDLGDLEVLFKRQTLNGNVPIYNFGLYDLNKPVMFTGESSLWAQDDALTFPTDNLWHHLVAVFEEGAWKIYLDNDSSMTQDAYGPQSIPTDDIPFGDVVIGENFEGSIDDIRFYQKALSADEVNLLFIAPSDCGMVGIEKIEKMVSIDLYPNPADSEIQCDLKDNLTDYVEVYSATGQLVMKMEIDPFDFENIDVSSLAEGMYGINFYWQNEMVGAEKFVIQR